MIRLVPGQVPLSDWAALWAGAPASLDPASAGPIAASAAAVIEGCLVAKVKWHSWITTKKLA